LRYTKGLGISLKEYFEYNAMFSMVYCDLLTPVNEFVPVKNPRHLGTWTISVLNWTSGSVLGTGQFGTWMRQFGTVWYLLMCYIITNIFWKFYENWLRNDDFIVILVLISMPFAILFMLSLVKSLFLVCQKPFTKIYFVPNRDDSKHSFLALSTRSLVLEDHSIP
jgi:hypothetical protein